MTASVNGVGKLNSVPTFGISIEELLKVIATVGAAKLILPLSVPFMETAIGVLLPMAKGALSVTCNVNVEPAGMVMSVLVLTPENAKVPNAGLPFVVMSVDGCAV